MKYAIILYLFIVVPIKGICVYTSGDFTITTSGLSDEYSKRFKDTANVNRLVRAFNKSDIPKSFAPIKITVQYQDGEGNVFLRMNGDDISNYITRDRDSRMYGISLNFKIAGRIFSSITSYLYGAGTTGENNMDIMKFDSELFFIKGNGDYLSIYARNFFAFGYGVQYRFYTHVHFKVNGTRYECVTTSSEALNSIAFFFIKPPKVDLSGKNTSEYYLLKFLEIDD